MVKILLSFREKVGKIVVNSEKNKMGVLHRERKKEREGRKFGFAMEMGGWEGILMGERSVMTME